LNDWVTGFDDCLVKTVDDEGYADFVLFKNDEVV